MTTPPIPAATIMMIVSVLVSSVFSPSCLSDSFTVSVDDLDTDEEEDEDGVADEMVLEDLDGVADFVEELGEDDLVELEDGGEDGVEILALLDFEVGKLVDTELDELVVVEQKDAEKIKFQMNYSCFQKCCN